MDPQKTQITKQTTTTASTSQPSVQTVTTPKPSSQLAQTQKTPISQVSSSTQQPVGNQTTGSSQQVAQTTSSSGRIRQPTPVRKQDTLTTSQGQNLVQTNTQKASDDQLGRSLEDAKRRSRDLTKERAEFQKQLDVLLVRNQSYQRRNSWMKYAAFFMMVLVIIQLLFVHVKLPDAKPCECPRPTPRPCPQREEVIIPTPKEDIVIPTPKEDIVIPTPQEDTKIIKHDDQIIVIDEKTKYYTYHDNKSVENNLLLVLHTIKAEIAHHTPDVIKFNNQLRIDRQVQYYNQISKENLYREIYAQIMYLNDRVKERTDFRNKNLVGDFRVELPCQDMYTESLFGRDCLFRQSILNRQQRENIELFTQMMLKQDYESKQDYTQQDISIISVLYNFIKQSQKLYNDDTHIWWAFESLEEALFRDDELKRISDYAY